MFQFLADPTIWVAFSTLVVLEVVLGIDNLVFIAVLAEKLPPRQRQHAARVGLSLALVMRLLLLASISWLMGLTAPWVTIMGHEFSARDLILLTGGLFLLYKATTELHSRLEGPPTTERKPKYAAAFWVVITQIVALDAVFSIDSVLTAIGITQHLPVMMAAVILAVLIMLLASSPLTRFVNAHPTVVMLCLGFLLMIGLSLVAEGFGYHMPKGYLYTAIGFSVMVEFFNQLFLRKSQQHLRGLTIRERTASAVLAMLSRPEPEPEQPITPLQEALNEDTSIFSDIEQEMMRGILKLGERSVRSIMTPRRDIVWLDVNASIEDMRKTVKEGGFSQYLVCDGGLEKPLGLVRTKDIVAHAGEPGEALRACILPALDVPDIIPVLDILEMLRQAPVKCILVRGAHDGLEGLVTLTDVMSAIAGEFGYRDEDVDYDPELNESGTWVMSGQTDLLKVEDVLEVHGLHDDKNRYVTLAGFILNELKKLPRVGEYVDSKGYRFTVVSLVGHRIADVEVTKLNTGA